MGVGAIRELSESVPTVLREPSRLYRGIMRDADDQRAGNHPGWLCYVGKPPRRYDLRTKSELSMDDRVLLVYVNEGRIVYTHRWELEDTIVPGRPRDHEDRYIEEINL